MALSNFIVTVAAVGAAVLLFTTDVRRSAAVFRRNARQLRHWLEDDSAAASKSGKAAAPKKLDSQAPKENLKEDKH